VDDTQILSGALLRDFLLKEEGRWVLEKKLGKTSIFRRIAVGSITKGIGWDKQPYNRIIKEKLFSAIYRKTKRILYLIYTGAIGKLLK